MSETGNTRTGSTGTDVLLQVEGMTCGHCEKAVRTALTGLHGVRAASVDLAAGRAGATIDPAQLAPADVAAAVTAAGYPARVEDS